jgi:DNA-binding CsgD family transcriptional regulator
MLYGREEQSVRIENQLAEARKGQCSTLVLVGEAGIGKTALLGHARERARGFRVLAATGVAAEQAVSFAGLDQLLGPVSDSFDDVPAPQAAALRGALDLTASARLDRDAVLRGAHSVLTALAAERPLLCTVDDADLLDAGSLAALAFAARRLGPGRIVLLFARRDTAEVPALEELPTLELPGLGVEAARALLDAQRPGLVAPAVVERLVAATGGNPLALLQAPALLSDAQLAGRAPLEYPLPVGEEVAGAFASRAEALSADARTALVTAAAADTQALRILTEDGAVTGITREALEECELGELLAIRNGLLVFPHPLARAAVYRSAPPSAQRDAHRRLAAASTGERRALHLAAAASGPDEEAAAELERAGLRVLRRSGYATGAGWLAQAAELTPDPAARAQRLARAAVASCVAGEPERARRLAVAGQELASGPEGAGVLALLDSAERGDGDAGPFLSDGLALLGLDPEEEPENLGLAALAEPDAVEAAVAAARDREAVWFLPPSLVQRARLRARAGAWPEAEADALEAKALAERLGQARPRADACVLLAALEARRGRAQECVALLDELVAVLDTAETRALKEAVLSLLDLGVGRLPEAIEELQAACAFPEDVFGPATLTVGVDLVEALVRAGRETEATAADDGERPELRAWRRALLAPDDDAFVEALAAPALTPFDRARIELSYGERLRRSGARAEAREHLRTAHEALDGLGAEPWAERARAELAATGETARRRDPSTLDDLTPQELRVLRAVAAGASVKEAAQSLFLSPKTIEFHLGKVYRKLGVHSRKELAVTLERLRAEGVDVVAGG